MKPAIRIIVILFTIAAFNSFENASAGDKGTVAGKTEFTKHFSESLFLVTDKGEFSLELLPDEKEYKIGKDVIGLVIHNSHDEDVEGAKLTITAEPAADNAKEPVIKDKGEGLYTVANLNIRREGIWYLKIQVKKKAVEDSAVFHFPAALSRPLPAGKYEPGKAPN
ncbi:MAG: hypothetical protein HZA17_05655 [Nitrospirae bacterium]|nr:hypothetical protein [Nitrospirota bacterium]